MKCRFFSKKIAGFPTKTNHGPPMMGLLGFLTKQRLHYSIELANDSKYWSLSALTLSEYRLMNKIFPVYINGRTLDAGAGALNLKSLISKYCSFYISLDTERRHPDVDLIADIRDMKQVDSDGFDTVVCSQVLEHIDDPWLALSEIHRVLKPGGCAIISVPHLSALHEEPHDYFRFTQYGLTSIVEKTGMEVIEINKVAGLFSFLSHPFSLIITVVCWKISFLKWIFWVMNRFIIVEPAIFFDSITGLTAKYPAGILLVCKKPDKELESQ